MTTSQGMQATSRKKKRQGSGLALTAVVPNLSGTRDKFHGKQFFHGLAVVGVVGVVWVVVEHAT